MGHETTNYRAEAGPGKEDRLMQVIEQGVAQLASEMEQGKSERLLHYLAFMARFHNYSYYNQLLIFIQKPSATRVAGYQTWQRMGYQVAKGAKGIRILAPRKYERVDAETGELTRGMYFIPVSVFDASQLANLHEKPLPEFFAPLEDDQQDLAERLWAAMQGDGITVSESDQLGDTQGLSAHGRVMLKAGLDSRSRFLVLLHEYAHELLHWDEQGKEQPRSGKECQAEAVSFVVAYHFGIHNPYSSDYLQQWGNTPADLSHELEAVRKASTHIIMRLKQGTSQSEAGAD